MASWMLLPPAFVTDDLALSANAVETYSMCPLKFKLRRDWQIPGEASAAMQFGNAVHTVLKYYYDPSVPMESGSPPRADSARGGVAVRGGFSRDRVVEEINTSSLIAAFQREFAKAVIEDPVQRKLYEELGIRNLQAMAQSRPRDSVDVIAAEAGFSFKMGRLKIKGRIDRMDRIEANYVRVIDYKTGTPWDQKDADDSLQLSIYAMGAMEMKYAPRELVLLNVRGNEEIVTFRTASQLDRARRKIEEAAEGIAAQEFEPKPGLHCRWCEFARLCPATEQRVLVPVQALTAGAPC